MNELYSYATPESVGIDSQWLINFLTRLEKQEIPIHSAIIMRHGKICMEAYYAPYNCDSLHRMFSITKSFVSLAIGLLEEEGKLSLDDHIIDYFPEKQPSEGPYEYTAMLTIRDMLQMKTCHNSTTYKAKGVTDWVGSFFTTKPTHVPGTNYSYDTSSTHVLGALVEKLSGMNMLDYLRVKFLDEIDFSKDAYVLPDPNGVSMGGSGLCATPLDILKVMILIANDGQWDGKQLLPADYIRTAKSRLSDPYPKQGTLEELQGYGYQIWSTRNGGYVLYGMGGQLALYVPDKDIYMITTADTQSRQGGIQFIYDAFWDEIYHKIDSNELPANKVLESTLKEFTQSRKLFVMPGSNTSPLLSAVNDVTYRFDDNKCGMTELSIHFDCTHNNAATGGTLQYTNNTGTHSIDFKIGDNALGMFPDYNLRYAASGSWRTDSNFLIRAQIIDSAIGCVYFNLNFKNDYITVMVRKIEESLFTEYDGVFSGKKVQ